MTFCGALAILISRIARRAAGSHGSTRRAPCARSSRTCCAAVAAILTACAPGGADFSDAYNGITAAEIARHTQRLSSDEFRGREPGTVGEQRTLEYLARAFEEIGLAPRGDAGYLQRVPMVRTTSDYNTRLALGQEALEFGPDFVAWTPRLEAQTGLDDSQLVFAGYGIVAPEYDWNDYEDVDWSGKTAVVLVNDPGFATGDERLFDGRAMTYYGRWTYKYEEAARQGADGLLIVHDDAPAGYGWNVVRNSWSVPQYDLRDADPARRLKVEGWITRAEAATLMARAGLDLDTLEAQALEENFSPVPLDETANITISSTIDELESYNVVGSLPGTREENEHIVYVAHWDHLGVDPSLDGDGIYNGAADNATGVAALLEVAEAFASLPGGTARSVTFLAVTAEEKGLLGSRYFAAHPIVDPGNIVAALSMDIMTRGESESEATIIGISRSELGLLAEQAAARQGRRARPHPSPESGYFYRSDHFSFARVGIPSLLLLNPGPPDSEYLREHYHEPSDEFDPSWSLAGAADDARLFFDIGFELAQSNTWPHWMPDNEFRSVREASRGE
jgi:Zn-dependent M28 family amino/carboxypeptidase